MEKAKTLLETVRIISGNDDDVLAEIEESICTRAFRRV